MECYLSFWVAEIGGGFVLFEPFFWVWFGFVLFCFVFSHFSMAQIHSTIDFSFMDVMLISSYILPGSLKDVMLMSKGCGS